MVCRFLHVFHFIGKLQGRAEAPFSYDEEDVQFDNRQYLPARADGPITDGNGIIVDDSRNTQQGSTLGPYAGRIFIEGNTFIAPEGKAPTNNFHRNDRPENERIVWKNNLLRGKPGKGTGGGERRGGSRAPCGKVNEAMKLQALLWLALVIHAAAHADDGCYDAVVSSKP